PGETVLARRRPRRLPALDRVGADAFSFRNGRARDRASGRADGSAMADGGRLADAAANGGSSARTAVVERRPESFPPKERRNARLDPRGGAAPARLPWGGAVLRRRGGAMARTGTRRPARTTRA